MKRWILWGIFAFLTASVPLTGAPRTAPERPGMGDAVNYPQKGIRFRIFRGCHPTPVVTHTEFYDVKDTEHKVKIVELNEIWTIRQTIASFVSESGISIKALVPSLPVPKGIKPIRFRIDGEEKECMRLTDFEEWVSSAELPEDFDFSRWLEFFGGTGWRDAGDMLKPKTKDLDVKTLIHGSCEFAVLAESKRYPSRRLALIFSFPLYPDSQQKQMLRILESCISSIALTEPQAKKEKEVRKISSQFGKKSSGKMVSEEYSASRERVIASVENTPGWWYMETEHFIIVSNIRRKRDINLIKNDIDKIYAAYQKIIPPLVPISAVSVIRIFDDHKEFLAFTEAEDWNAGIWMPRKQELAFFLDSEADKREQAYQREFVLHHEMFHQYLHYALNGVLTHVWFNEGFANFFEKTVCRSAGKYSIPIAKEDLEWGKKVLESPYADVNRLLKLSYDEFYDDYEKAYPAAFALAVFLAKGAQQIKDAELRARYLAIPYIYYKTCLETRSHEKAQEAAWKDIDMEEFNEEFRDFWSAKKRYGRLNPDKLIPIDESRDPENLRKNLK